jgi:hypothetical protein
VSLTSIGIFPNSGIFPSAQVVPNFHAPHGPLCSVLGRSGGRAELTQTPIKRPLDLATAGRTNDSSMRCSCRRPSARQSDAARPTASARSELPRTTRSDCSELSAAFSIRSHLRDAAKPGDFKVLLARAASVDLQDAIRSGQLNVSTFRALRASAARPRFDSFW